MFKKAIFVSTLLLSALCVAEEIPAEEPVLTSVCSEKECYIVEKELGNGAFGKVYAVRDSKGERYALKSYTPNDFGGPFADALKDAQREFEIGQALNHPNIIKSIDWFKDETDTFYLLLELVDGERVNSKERKSLSGEQAIHLSLQLLDALKYGSEMEYIYLDLHANNVMISDDIDIKVIDVSSFFSFQEIIELFSAKKQKGIVANPIRDEKIKKFIEKHQAKFDLIKKRKDISNNTMIHYFHMWTFDDMVDMQLSIISKSTMDRISKIKMFAAIKEVSWNYSEDYQEGIDLPVEFYFDQLKEILISN